MTRTKEEQKEYQHNWYLNNKERHNALSKAAVELRKEERKEYAHKYYLEHKDYYKKIQQSWNSTHAELRKEYTKRFRENRGEEYKKIEKRVRAEWGHKNKDAICAISARRRALKLNATGNGITSEQAIQLKKETGGRCVYCGQIKKLTIDHVIPLVSGGRHDVDNAVPACQSCNSKKKDKSLLVFLLEQYSTLTIRG
jgi:5-methylcytosine-specific restriction endonuclease McrA